MSKKTKLPLFAAGFFLSLSAQAVDQSAPDNAPSPDNWKLVGLVLDNDTSKDYLNRLESYLLKNTASVTQMEGYSEFKKNYKRVTSYKVDDTYFVIFPWKNDLSSLQHQFNKISVAEPIQVSKSELDFNIESILLSPSPSQPGPAEINSFWEHGYTGKGMLAGIMDSGVDIQHRAFKNKDIQFLGSDDERPRDYSQSMRWEWLRTAPSFHLRSTHGTAVAGAMFGNPENGKYKGVAKDANAVSGYAGEPSDVLWPSADSPAADLIRKLRAMNLNATTLIHIGNSQPDALNYSYGNGRIPLPKTGGADWSFWARFFDAVSYKNDILLAKSAGNDGSKYPDGSSADKPLPYSISRPADNFNGLTVANVDTTTEYGKTSDRSEHIIRYTSSRGPTTDGRRKPDIAAPGHNTRTAAPNPARDYQGPFAYKFDSEEYKEYDPVSSTRYATGTSLASPHVGGAALLVKQALLDRDDLDKRKTRYAQLTKAILLNSADNSGDVLPEDLPSFSDGGWSPSRGWGYMDLTQAYAEYGYAQQFKLGDKIKSAHYRVRPNNPYKKLKVTLVSEQQRFDRRARLLPLTLKVKESGRVIGSDRSIPKGGNEAIQNVLQVTADGNANNQCVEIVVKSNLRDYPLQPVSLGSNMPLIPVNNCD